MTPVKSSYAPEELERMQQEAIRQMRQMYSRSQLASLPALPPKNSSSASSPELPSQETGANQASQGGASAVENRSVSSGTHHPPPSAPGKTRAQPPQGQGNPPQGQGARQVSGMRNQQGPRPVQTAYSGQSGGRGGLLGSPRNWGNRGQNPSQRISPRRPGQNQGNSQRMGTGGPERPPRQSPPPQGSEPSRTDIRQGEGQRRASAQHSGGRPMEGHRGMKGGFDLGSLLSSLGLGNQGQSGQKSQEKGEAAGLLDGLFGPEGINLFEKDSLLLLGLLYFLYREGAELKLLLALGYILL